MPVWQAGWGVRSPSSADRIGALLFPFSFNSRLFIASYSWVEMFFSKVLLREPATGNAPAEGEETLGLWKRGVQPPTFHRWPHKALHSCSSPSPATDLPFHWYADA